MLRTIIAIGSLLLLTQSALAFEKKKLYKWVDKNGNVHYSDKPVKGAVEHKVKRLPTIKMEKPKANPLGSFSSDKKPPHFSNYESIAISSPENDGVIRNNASIVNLTAQLTPPLQPKHQLRFYLDGSSNLAKVGETSLQIEKVAFGEHSAYVAVYDHQGKKLSQSKSVKFTLLNFINPKNRNNSN